MDHRGRSWPPRGLDRKNRPGRCRVGLLNGCRTQVVKQPPAARPEAGQPLVGRADRDPGSLCRICDTPAPFPHPLHQRDSTMKGHPRILMHVHPGAQVGVGWLRNPSLTSRPRMNNLHSFDS